LTVLACRDRMYFCDDLTKDSEECDDWEVKGLCLKTCGHCSCKHYYTFYTCFLIRAYFLYLERFYNSDLFNSFPVGKIVKKQCAGAFLLIRHSKYSAILSNRLLFRRFCPLG